MNPVTIVTIKQKLPIFKGEEAANAIELILCEEHGFEIISQKDLYKIGDKAVYIQPDYCLSEIPLFDSFIQPGGDPRKSKLGSNHRIRAVKFNFHRGDGNPIFSQGILLPFKEVCISVPKFMDKDTPMDEALGIVKWEQPDETNIGGVKGGASSNFPVGMYKTDEENINNIWKYITFPIHLIGTEKVDGSSITIWKNGDKSGICSRNLGKPLTYNKIVRRRTKNILERLMFWTKPNINVYEEVESDSDFVKYGKPYLNEMIKHNIDGVLRGELNGGSLKGSGNKNNPASKEKANIKWFGSDSYDNGITVKDEYIDFIDFIEYMNVGTNIQFNITQELFNREFTSKEDLMEECNQYFKHNMIEGIVVRTPDSKFSAKIMNPEYDAKK